MRLDNLGAIDSMFFKELVVDSVPSAAAVTEEKKPFKQWSWPQ
jgi:hypothetical protein